LLGKDRISRNRRNLQNRNSTAPEIAIRFGPKILLKCDRRETGPKYPTIRLDDGINLRSHSITTFNRSASAFCCCMLCDSRDLAVRPFHPSCSLIDQQVRYEKHHTGHRQFQDRSMYVAQRPCWRPCWRPGRRAVCARAAGCLLCGRSPPVAWAPTTWAPRHPSPRRRGRGNTVPAVHGPLQCGLLWRARPAPGALLRSEEAVSHLDS
jgi:hypothetical protein